LTFAFQNLAAAGLPAAAGQVYLPLLLITFLILVIVC
jgi:hypothetical protein